MTPVGAATEFYYLAYGERNVRTRTGQEVIAIIDPTASRNGKEYSSSIVLTLLQRCECGSAGTPRELQSSIHLEFSEHPFDVRFLV